MTLLAAGGSVAVFAAGGPGEHLSPVGRAAEQIDLIQSGESILWSALSGTVAAVRTIGWPVSDGAHDLGGALVIEDPVDPLAGTVNIGEPPMTVEFELGS